MGILRMSRWMAVLAMAAAVLGVPGTRARGDVTYPARPLDRAFIVDEAKLLSDSDATKIKAICDKALTDVRVPILVCTITSMADHGASGWAIERYAMNLFDEWGIGDKQYNYGILLLVSKGDRKARIELGAGWTRERDAACANIMSMDIVPAFKREQYSAGILKGVQQLDALARVAQKPAPPATQGGASGSGSTTTNSPTSTGTPGDGAAAPTLTRSNSSSPANSYGQTAYPYSNSYRSRGSGSGFGGLGACLFIPVIGVIILLRMLKGAIGWGGGGWGRSMYPGGYYGGGWGSGSSFGGGSSGGSWGGGGGGGFSGGSFGGGSSGGGGATGSW